MLSPKALRIPGSQCYIAFNLYTISPNGHNASWKAMYYDRDLAIEHMRNNWRDFRINMDCLVVLLDAAGKAFICIDYLFRDSPFLKRVNNAQGQAQRSL